MSDDRRSMLETIRRARRRGELGADARAALDARLARPQPGPIPARSQGDRRQRLEVFVRMAEESAATVARVADPAAVPAAVAEYLARENLPARIRLAPDPEVTDLPWQTRPLLAVSAGDTRGEDAASLTPAFAGVAETGTLALISGSGTPTTLNLLPDAHIVLLPAARVVASYEEVWMRLRARFGAGRLPRTVNLITGPSRSADIEQTLQIGAHGPRRLHIILLDGEAET